MYGVSGIIRGNETLQHRGGSPVTVSVHRLPRPEWEGAQSHLADQEPQQLGPLGPRVVLADLARHAPLDIDALRVDQVLVGSATVAVRATVIPGPRCAEVQVHPVADLDQLLAAKRCARS